MSDTNPKTIETIRANANTREQRVQRLAKIAGELLQIGEDTVSEYLARDAEIARLTAALRTETTMKEQLQDQLEERRLAYRAEWERAEGLTAELAGARRAATASIVSVNADRDRLTAELAEARAAVEHARMDVKMTSELQKMAEYDASVARLSGARGASAHLADVAEIVESIRWMRANSDNPGDQAVYVDRLLALFPEQSAAEGRQG